MARTPLAVLFDLDGTLVDTVPFILESVAHAFEGIGPAPTKEEWIAGIGTPLRQQLAQFAPRPTDTERLYERYRTYWLEHHDRRTRLFPGMEPLVRALHAAGHPLGVVTAKIEAGAHRSLRHVGLEPLMGAIIAADSGVPAKPAPHGVWLAATRLGCVPSGTVFIGDSPHDVAAGNAAGAISVGATWGACTRAQLAAARARHVVETIDELAALLSRLQAEA
jgi:pyrophosphatase PpaX